MALRYRVSGTVDEAHLSSVIGAYSAAGLRVDYDPEITLSLMSKFNDAPKPAPMRVEVIDTMHPPAKKRTTKRVTKSNGGEWPAKGSIYDVVLQAIQLQPQTAVTLREILKGAGFSSGSLNSSIGRLEKAGKVKRVDDGWIAA